jgi:hypothetical protein
MWRLKSVESLHQRKDWSLGVHSLYLRLLRRLGKEGVEGVEEVKGVGCRVTNRD